MEMGESGTRLIRETEWAFRLFGQRRGHRARGRRHPWPLGVLALCAFAIFSIGGVLADALAVGDHKAAATDHHHHAITAAPSLWDGSPEGKAYSESNHHLAGLLVLLIGVSELRQALGLYVFAWTRILLPLSLLTAGLFLLIWSDHEAWPIGSLSVAETFWGFDPEILQHKTYGVLAVVVGSIEWLRRQGKIQHIGWAVPLPLFAIVGGFMLFAHSHGIHPAAHKIQLHHTVMGLLAISAGSSKLFSDWRAPSRNRRTEMHAHTDQTRGASRLELVWALLLLVISLQLLFYSE